MSATNASSLLETAIHAITEASGICRAVQSAMITDDTITKKDKSPVTIADLAVQAAIFTTLHRADPTIPFVGEEDAAEIRANSALLARVHEFAATVHPDLTPEAVCDAIDLGNNPGGPTGTFWTLDPIDGTKGYLRRQQYAIALALITDGVVQLGVLGCPALDGGQLFAAQRGHGVFQAPLNAPETLAAIPRADAPTRFCESVESGHSDQDRSARIAASLGIIEPPLRIDSQCKYAVLAQAQAAVYLRLPTRADYQEKIWDHAAGALLVTEAGGTVSDIHGAPLDFSKGRTLAANQGVIASMPPIKHPDLIQAVVE